MIMGYRFYLSGAITDNPNYVEDFERAEHKIAMCAVDSGLASYDVEFINPAKVGKTLPNFGYEEYMALDLFLLSKCDAIYMIRGYEKSRGAVSELLMAKNMGLEIFYESEEHNEQGVHKTV